MTPLLQLHHPAPMTIAPTFIPPPPTATAPAPMEASDALVAAPESALITRAGYVAAA